MSALGNCDRCAGHLGIVSGKWQFCHACALLVPQRDVICPRCAGALGERTCSAVACDQCGWPVPDHALTREAQTFPVPAAVVAPPAYQPVLDPLALHRRIEKLEAAAAASSEERPHKPTKRGA